MLVVKTQLPICPDGRLLQIRGGLTTIVDSDLYDFLNQFKWFPLKSASTVYVVTRKIVNGKAYTIRLHRLITKAPDYMKVHHINHNSLDNRLKNLDVITERTHRHFDGWHVFER